MNITMLTYFTQNLMKEAQIIADKFRNNGQNINDNILTTKLNEYLNHMNYALSTTNSNLIHNQQSKYSKDLSTSQINHEPISPEQRNIDWYYIKPYATYYQDTNIDHSPLSSIHNNQSNSKKILVNVINDKSSLKSLKIKRKPKKRIYPSSNTLLGSQTIEDLFQVINNQRLPKSSIKRVVIIDRYNSNSIIPYKSPNTVKPTATNTVSIIPTTGYIMQQPISNIYLTTTTTSYIANMNSY